MSIIPVQTEADMLRDQLMQCKKDKQIALMILNGNNPTNNPPIIFPMQQQPIISRNIIQTPQNQEEEEFMKKFMGRTPFSGGSNKFYDKYQKYKHKYLLLKNKL